jgi:hypothetical protein
MYKGAVAFLLDQETNVLILGLIEIDQAVVRAPVSGLLTIHISIFRWI